MKKYIFNQFLAMTEFAGMSESALFAQFNQENPVLGSSTL